MKNIEAYFDLIDSIIRRSGAIDHEVTYLIRDPFLGIINGTLHFADDSKLEFSERVRIVVRNPIKQSYRYEYLREDQTIFRYDNSPHHRRIPNFPHHKHIGRKVISAREPTLKDVLNEIMDLIGQRT